MKSNPFERHRFLPAIILLAVRWYCRYPLSYRDVRDLLAERGINIDPATINRRVVKFGPLVAKRTRKLKYPRSMHWHVDATYIRVSGKWRYLQALSSYDHCHRQGTHLPRHYPRDGTSRLHG